MIWVLIDQEGGSERQSESAERQETGWGDTGAASVAEDRRGRNGCGWEGGLQLGCCGLGLRAEE